MSLGNITFYFDIVSYYKKIKMSDKELTITPYHIYQKKVGAVRLYGVGNLKEDRCTIKSRAFNIWQARYMEESIRSKITYVIGNETFLVN